MAAIHVKGLTELQRAFRAADREVERDLKDALEEAAAPVRSDAQRLAASEIRNIEGGDPWSRMRIGSSRSVVWVAPVERGVKGRGNQRKRRRNLADLLLGRAMEPALERNRTAVEHRLDEMIDEVTRVWERGR